jgi:excisionase domain protein
MPLIQLTDKIPAETIAKARLEAKELLNHDFTIAFPEAANPEDTEALSCMVTELISALAAGKDIQLRTHPQSMTTIQAARVIGISRPELMRAIRNKDIPTHMVGNHHRLRFKDVEKFRKKRLAELAAEKEKALLELWKFEEENGLTKILTP